MPLRLAMTPAYMGDRPMIHSGDVVQHIDCTNCGNSYDCEVITEAERACCGVCGCADVKLVHVTTIHDTRTPGICLPLCVYCP